VSPNAILLREAAPRSRSFKCWRSTTELFARTRNRQMKTYILLETKIRIIRTYLDSEGRLIYNGVNLMLCGNGRSTVSETRTLSICIYRLTPTDFAHKTEHRLFSFWISSFLTRSYDFTPTVVYNNIVGPQRLNVTHFRRYRPCKTTRRPCS